MKIKITSRIAFDLLKDMGHRMKKGKDFEYNPYAFNFWDFMRDQFKHEINRDPVHPTFKKLFINKYGTSYNPAGFLEYWFHKAIQESGYDVCIICPNPWEKDYKPIKVLLRKQIETGLSAQHAFIDESKNRMDLGDNDWGVDYKKNENK
ncbi:hypothetical protein DMA11_10255 [Marinilabiliaceae bacterium JC017]|nr:hypothetical protein DMA11_10255 [Marinilabiliaceae bacterium JC017]